MTKTKTIMISILLLGSGALIKYMNDSQSANENIGFFAGLVFGAGLAVLIQTLVKKKKVE